MGKIRKAGATVGRAVPAVLCDLAGLMGAGLIAYGAWRHSPTLGLVVAGAMLLAGAALVARGRR